MEERKRKRKGGKEGGEREEREGEREEKGGQREIAHNTYSYTFELKHIQQEIQGTQTTPET